MTYPQSPFSSRLDKTRLVGNRVLRSSGDQEMNDDYSLVLDRVGL